MVDASPRRPYPGQSWKHGWIPVTATAMASKKKEGNRDAIKARLSEARQAALSKDSSAAGASWAKGKSAPGSSKSLPSKPSAKAPAQTKAPASPAKKPVAKAAPKSASKPDSSATSAALDDAKAAMKAGKNGAAVNALTRAMKTASTEEKKAISSLRSDLAGKVMGKDKVAPKASPKPDPTTGAPEDKRREAPKTSADLEKEFYESQAARTDVDRREGGKRVPDAEMEAAIEDIVRENPGNDGWISMTKLREGIQKRGMTREQTDEILKKMYAERPDFNMVAAGIVGHLSPQDHADALKFGPEFQHQIKLTPRDVAKGSGGNDKPAVPAPEAPKASPAKAETPAKPAPSSAPSTSGKSSSGVKNHDGPPVSGAKSGAPTIPNTWGGGPSEVAYHPDGDLAYALRSMGDDRKMEIDGDSLENVVGRLVTDTYAGRRSSQEVLDEAKKIRDRLPKGSQARQKMDSAVSNMDAPNTPTPTVPDGTPAVLKKLVENMHTVPEVRKDPGKDMDKLLKIIDDWNDGKVSPVRLGSLVRQQVYNKRHESREASADLRRFIQDAMADIDQAMRSGQLKPSGR